MALEAGRVGVRKDQVDSYGRVKGGGETDPAVTKLQTQVGTYSFRTNPEDGRAQYRQSDDGDWVNFSSGGGSSPVLLWENSDPTSYSGGTIEVPNIENYDYILVECIASSTGVVINNGNSLIKTEQSADIDIRLLGGNYTLPSGVAVVSIRIGTFEHSTKNLILQNVGYFYTNGNASYTNSSANYAIPYKIYGINLSI